jgi:hypothetical protein
MIAADIELVPESALQSLSRTLGTYKDISGLTSKQVLVKQGRKLSIELYKAFKREKPAEGSIFTTLQRRGFRFGGRNGTTSTGISERARDRASQRMGGHKSILGRIAEADGGKIILSGVRIGKRGRRLVSKKRTAGIGAVSGDASTRFVQSLNSKGPLERDGDVVLNRRAVETIEEANLRRAGRGFLAASWLYRRWIVANKIGGQEAILLNQNPRSSLGFGLLGRIRLKDSQSEQSLTLTSHVPGIEAIGHTRGRFTIAVRHTQEDIKQYLINKHVKVLKSSVRGGREAGLREALVP